MIKFRVEARSAIMSPPYLIYPVKIEKETPTFIFYKVKGVLRKIRKTDYRQHWFGTWREAQEWCISHAEYILSVHKKAVVEAKIAVSKAMNMKPNYLRVGIDEKNLFVS